MFGPRSRELAALLVAGALAATAVAPAFVVSSGSAAPFVAGPAAASGPGGSGGPGEPVVARLLPTASPDSAGLPVSVPEPEPSARETESFPPAPRCAPAPAGLTAARVVSHGSRTRKVVALTFDDGYNPSNTLRILDILKRAHIPATFFVTGRAVELFPGVWREVAAAGFPIADHTYDHPRLAGLCFATQLRELTRQAGAVRDLLGHDPVALMRPPYGSRDRNTTLAAAAAGDQAVVTWDVDTRDWSGINSWGVTRRALAGGPGSIVLMHTLYATTAAALPRIIAGYRARGFAFVTVPTLLGLP